MKLLISKLARDDLKEIRTYLSGFGEAPPKKFRESFEKFCIQAAEMPYSFGRYRHNQNYRRAVIAFDYLVFFQIEERGDTVKVCRVLHGKRNTEPHL